ncbi:hypothetical protein LPJ53_005465, partial [Coemansia erecta]
RALYSAYLERVAGVGPMNPGTNYGVLAHGNMLLAICNHPAVFQLTVENGRAAQGPPNGGGSSSSSSFISGAASTTTTPVDDEGSVEPSDDLSIAQFIAAGDEWIRNIYTAHNLLLPLPLPSPLPLPLPSPAHAPLATPPAPAPAPAPAPPPLRVTPEMMLPAHSIKTQMALHIIRESIAGGERVLVFSRSIPTLDYLQQAIETAGLATLGRQMLRIDGSTVVGQRQGLIDRFNAAVSEFRVFLISSGTGSIGINLVSASRIIIYDVGWNPLYDEQAVARVYRYGQRRRVFVYRLMTTGTWEQRLIDNNIFKVSLTRRVVDKQSMGRRVSKENAQRYLQHPPAQFGSITEAEASTVVADHHDDAVLGSLVAGFRSRIANIIPQATLLANENEPLDEAALAEVDMSVHREKQRLGQAPLLQALPTAAAEHPAVGSAFTAAVPSVAVVAPVPVAVSAVALPVTPAVAPAVAPTADILAATPAILPTAAPVATPVNTPATPVGTSATPVDTPATPADTPATAGVNNDDNTFMGSKIGDMSALRALAMAEVAFNRLETFQVAVDEEGSREYLRNLVTRWMRGLKAYIYSETSGSDMRSQTPMCQLGAQLGKLTTIYSMLPLVSTGEDDDLRGLLCLLKKTIQKS